MDNEVIKCKLCCFDDIKGVNQLKAIKSFIIL